MSWSKRTKKSKKKIDGQFFPMPHSIIKSAECCNLSYSSFKLLMDICIQFNGENNGGLVATLCYFRKFGWNSNATITKCLKELRESGFLILTRQGMRYPSPTPSFYAISWLDLDVKSDLDIDPSCYEKKKFSSKVIFNSKRQR